MNLCKGDRRLEIDVDKPTISENHARLVKRARRWLFARYPLVISELASGMEVADALGIGHGESTLIECKVSRSDFIADRKKFFRAYPDCGLGNLRYYLCPKGLIESGELPEGWGLLYSCENQVREITKAKPFSKDHQKEISILASLIRRIGNAPHGVSIKNYFIETKNRAVALIKAPDRHDYKEE